MLGDSVRRRQARKPRRAPAGATPRRVRWKFWAPVLLAVLALPFAIGYAVAVFVVFHLLHFTTGTVHPQFDAHDVYRNVIIGFRSWPVALFYIVAMVALAFHLWHGVWSMFQTMGLINPKSDKLVHRFAVVATLVIAVGFISVPMAVLAGLIA